MLGDREQMSEAVVARADQTIHEHGRLVAAGPVELLDDQVEKQAQRESENGRGGRGQREEEEEEEEEKEEEERRRRRKRKKRRKTEKSETKKARGR